MNRLGIGNQVLIQRVPYMCGDEPCIGIYAEAATTRSLHVWG